MRTIATIRKGDAKEWMPEVAVQSTDARLSSMEPHATLARGPITAGS